MTYLQISVLVIKHLSILTDIFYLLYFLIKMKLKLSFILVICSYFYHVECSKQLFSLIEKGSSQQHEKKESIFGSYLEKVEKKIKKTDNIENLDSQVNLAEEHSIKHKKSKINSAKKKYRKKVLRKKRVLSHVKAQDNKKKHEKTHTVFDRVKSEFKLQKNGKKNNNKHLNKYTELKKRIVFLEKKMKKYINLNKELIREIRENKKKVNHKRPSSKNKDEASDDD